MKKAHSLGGMKIFEPIGKCLKITLKILAIYQQIEQKYLLSKTFEGKTMSSPCLVLHRNEESPTY